MFTVRSIFLFCLTAGFLCSAAYAEPAKENSLVFKGGVNLGFRTLDFEQDFDQGVLTNGAVSTNPAKRKTDYHQSFRSADFSLAAAWSDFYLAGNYETNISTEDSTVSATFTDLDPVNGTSTSSGSARFEFDRDDYYVTLGWNAFDSFSVFTGYKSGTTDTTRPTRSLNLLGAWSASEVDTTFKEAGPFVGMSYNWPMGHGVLTLTGAYAYMKGDYEEEGNEVIYQRLFLLPNPDVLLAISQQALDYDGHTDGLSFNLSWNVLASDHVGYYFGLRWQQYEFDADTSVNWVFYDIVDPFGAPAVTASPLSGPGEVSNSETLTSFYAGVNYLF